MDGIQKFDPNDYNGGQLVITAIVLLVLTYIAVGLRCYVKLRIIKAFSVDDLLVVLSLYQTFTVLAYEVCMTLIKLAVAIFLLRIAVKRRFIWLIKGSMVILTVWSLSLFLFTIFECSPVQAQWDITITDGKCISPHSIEQATYAQSALGISTDWFYAVLPLLMLWNVKLGIRKKVTVGIILGMGIFVATLVRFKYIITVTALDDLLYATTTTMVWTFIEPGVAIVAASLVTIRPLLRAIGLAGFDSTDHSAYPDTTHATLSLRGDIPMDNWHATSYSHKKLRRGKTVNADSTTSQRGMKTVSETMIYEKNTTSRLGVLPPEMPSSEMSDDGSEEFILTPGKIRRTVDVSIRTDGAGDGDNQGLHHHPPPSVTAERSRSRAISRNR
ncbi:hypothetical protein B7463_g1045, partial [Scytalidium lignicola]